MQKEENQKIESPANSQQTENNSSVAKPNKLKTLRTYQGDMQEYISKNNTSITKIAVAEQKNRIQGSFQENVEKYEIKNRFLVTLGISLFVIGLIVVGTVYFMQTRSTGVERPLESALIGYTEKVSVIVNSKQILISDIESRIETWDTPANSILYINPVDSLETEKETSIERIASFIFENMPNNMIRALEDEYMIGLYSFDKNVPFIILKTKDYGISYSGMLKWEENILKDLGFMFKTTGDSSSYSFIDETRRNKDLRIVKDNQGKTVFLYSFLDRETIILTSDEDAFNALFGKYINNQMVR